MFVYLRFSLQIYDYMGVGVCVSTVAYRVLIVEDEPGVVKRQAALTRGVRSVGGYSPSQSGIVGGA